MNYLSSLFKVVKHRKLNREVSPCEESDSYDYSDCITRVTALAAGCQNFWTNLEGIPVCSSHEQMIKFSDEYRKIITLEQNDIQKRTGCLLPCNYYQYKVRITPMSSLFLT